MAKYKRLFKPEVWEDINKESKDLLADYELELKSTGKSEKTIYQYVADMPLKGWIYDILFGD